MLTLTIEPDHSVQAAVQGVTTMHNSPQQGLVTARISLGWATFGANWVVLCCGLKRPLGVLVQESLGHALQQDSVSGNWPGATC